MKQVSDVQKLENDNVFNINENEFSFLFLLNDFLQQNNIPSHRKSALHAQSYLLHSNLKILPEVNNYDV
jgi:hypothetical protein